LPEAERLVASIRAQGARLAGDGFSAMQSRMAVSLTMIGMIANHARGAVNLFA
jgi:hypothetical protein